MESGVTTTVYQSKNGMLFCKNYSTQVNKLQMTIFEATVRVFILNFLNVSRNAHISHLWIKS